MAFGMNFPLIGATVLLVLAAPAFADDCTPVKTALMTIAKTPYSETITTTDAAGKPVTSHMVQTATTKYVERNGKWTALPVSSAELVDTLNAENKTGKMTCTRVSPDTVNGQPAVIYMVRRENNGTIIEGKLWISSQNRQLKAEMTSAGRHFITTTDYDHVQAPVGAAPPGR